MTDAMAEPAGITADSPPLREAIARTLSLPVLQQLSAREGPQYQCPGESEPISRAVHLSRMARYYPACRTCAQAEINPRTQSAKGSDAEADRRGAASAATRSTDGIRGTYLNEIGRADAERLAMAVAQQLWKSGRRGRDLDDPGSADPHTAAGPEVVVGRDVRTSSPDIACGVVRGLRRMGCRVVDLGVVSRPSVDFAVYHLRSTAGIYVTGAGGPAAITGLDIVDADGIPWSRPGRLERIADWRQAVSNRPTRTGGTLRSFDIAAPERVDFRRHWSGLRRCRAGVVIDDPTLRAQVEAWFADSGCSLTSAAASLGPFGGTELPVQVRKELRGQIKREDLLCIVRIADDGQRVQLWDEQGRLVAPEDWLLRVAEQTLVGAQGSRLIVGSDVPALARGRLKAHGIDVQPVPSTAERLVAMLSETRSGMAADGQGRIWFADHYPLCHGLVTLTHLLRLASEAGQPVSHWTL